MALREIRRQRFEQLIRDHFKEKKSAAAAALQWPESVVGRYFVRTKNGRGISDEKARYIERKLNLPKYWLDEQDDATTPPVVIYKVGEKTQKQVLKLIEGITAAQLDDIIAQIKAYHETNQAVLKELGRQRRGTTVKG